MKSESALLNQESRPWPLPSGPWMMNMVWENLLFAHWRIDAQAIRDSIPRELDLDEFDGSAWIGLVPFGMKDVGPRGFPKIKAIGDFPEINVRTYVTCQGKPGVWFFSLDVPHRLPVWLARRFFHLPYFYSDVAITDFDKNGGWTDYHFRRDELSLDCRYRPIGPIQPAIQGSFAHWATERYCLYSADARGRVYRGEIAHQPWPLQAAEWEAGVNTALANLPVGEMSESLYFSERLEVVAWWVDRLS